MWAVANQTRFKAERTFARDRDGAEVWVVVVRATFVFDKNGVVTAAEDQQDVCLHPIYLGKPGQSGLRYDLDAVRVKSGTDVVLHASAYSPDGRPVPWVDASWQVGPLSKTLRVHGDRTWRRGPLGFSPGPPTNFRSLPIRYERAFGGPLTDEPDAPRDPANTAGVGRVAAEGAPVPNCEYPDQPVASPTSRARVAGFGPIPCEWSPRVKLAGTYDDSWRNERQPLVPSDFQDDYFRCAPADQQADGFLKGGEEVVLRNLTPEGLVRFQLPRVALGFSTNIAGGTAHHKGDLYSVIIEPDERRLVMVWQSSLPCHHTLYTLKGTRVYEKERLALRPIQELQPAPGV